MSAISMLKNFAGKTPIIRTLYEGAMKWGLSSHETWQPEYVEFIAKRRGISNAKAKAMVDAAQKQFFGGWLGDDFRKFSEQALETFRPLHDDATDAEVIETYKFHGPIDFLRMLGYVLPKPAEVEPIVSRLASKSHVDMIDYGCGLAHRSLTVARALQAKGVKVHLTLVDIRKEYHGLFLDHLCKKFGVSYDFIEITADKLYPELPPHDYCDNVDVLEHVREPLTVVNNTHRALRPGGYFLAYCNDAIEEMMHISPDLSAVRRRFDELGYVKVASLHQTPLFQKPAQS
jgi:SAM-dependent methyltransferase